MYCLCGVSKLGIVIKQEQEQEIKCFDCGSNVTNKRPDRMGYFWSKVIIQGQHVGYRCKKCLNKIHNPKNSIRNNPRRISFKGKQLAVTKTNPRTGECSHCHRTVASGDIKRTAMHHDLYDPKNPLSNTRELCASCHRKYHTGSLE